VNERTRIWLLGLLPLALLAALIAAIVAFDPVGELASGFPPVEELVFERVALAPGEIRATVLNNGPDPVTIAQLQVDEAYWEFAQEPPGDLPHLGKAELVLPYPWVAGEAHEVKVVTSTGLTFAHEIAVAVETPRPNLRLVGLFALIGLYVGVLPVALGLLWYPLMRRLGPAGRDFVLALTVGLLAFLFVDTVEDGLEAGRELAGVYQGKVLFVLVAALAYLGIEALGAWLAKRPGAGLAWTRALLVALGIGLHNFGEGLAIGAAFALGELALGTLLILGFTLHNTTEGLAIVAPLVATQVRWRQLLGLGLLAGAPTILGAWLGGFTYSLLWSVVFLAVGAGAIAQVAVQIARGTAGQRSLGELLTNRAVLFGLLTGFGVMYATGLLVG
jgi:hypothetical protein